MTTDTLLQLVAALQTVAPGSPVNVEIDGTWWGVSDAIVHAGDTSKGFGGVITLVATVPRGVLDLSRAEHDDDDQEDDDQEDDDDPDRTRLAPTG